MHESGREENIRQAGCGLADNSPSAATSLTNDGRYSVLIRKFACVDIQRDTNKLAPQHKSSYIALRGTRHEMAGFQFLRATRKYKGSQGNAELLLFFKAEVTN